MRALLSIRIGKRNATTELEIHAWLDTAFNGTLVLPTKVAIELGIVRCTDLLVDPKDLSWNRHKISNLTPSAAKPPVFPGKTRVLRRLTRPQGRTLTDAACVSIYGQKNQSNWPETPKKWGEGMERIRRVYAGIILTNRRSKSSTFHSL